jgi:hypothetical protein
VLEGDWVVERPVLSPGSGNPTLAYLADVPIMDWLSPLLQRPAPVLVELLDQWKLCFGVDRTEAAFRHLWQQHLLRQVNGAD